MTYLQARTANEVLKSQERCILLQKLKGEVVDRARAIALVFRLARRERDAWAGWPARVAAMIAADLGIGAHAMQTVLEPMSGSTSQSWPRPGRRSGDEIVDHRSTF